MSNMWLALALVGTFLTIFLLGVIVDMLMRERNRPLTLLQSHLGTVAEPADYRSQQLQGSILERMLLPGGKKVGRALVKLTPFDLYGKLNRHLVMAGEPPR